MITTKALAKWSKDHKDDKFVDTNMNKIIEALDDEPSSCSKARMLSDFKLVVMVLHNRDGEINFSFWNTMNRNEILPSGRKCLREIRNDENFFPVRLSPAVSPPHGIAPLIQLFWTRVRVLYYK